MQEVQAKLQSLTEKFYRNSKQDHSSIYDEYFVFYVRMFYEKDKRLRGEGFRKVIGYCIKNKYLERIFGGEYE